MGYSGLRTSRGLLVAILALAAITVGTAFAQAAQISLPEQSLSQSLKDLARQTGSNILFTPESVRGMRAPELRGQMTVSDAITKLLGATDLEAVPDGNGGLIVRRKSTGPAKTDTTQPSNSDLTEIVVTGTHIRGEAPIGSHVTVYTRRDLDQSGAATVDQFARQMVENFSGVDSLTSANIGTAALARSGGDASSNIYGGSAFNLHGLGASSTLTLLNGQRLAPAGTAGSFADVSQIPLSAIDHIEVLADGASAIYGADAVAGVINIVTRKDFDGAETSVRYGGATEGGAQELTASQLLGTSWSSGSVFFNYELDRQHGLDASKRDYIADQGGPTLIAPISRRDSFLLSGRQALVPDIVISGNAMYSDRRVLNQASAIAPDIDFVSNTSTTAPSQQYSASLTLDVAIAKDWRIDLTGNYSKVRESSDDTEGSTYQGFSSVFSDATTASSDIAGVELLANGPLFSLPAGQAKAAIGGSFREEKFDQSEAIDLAALTSTGVPTARRHVKSIFGELTLPLLSPASDVFIARRLELSLAGRYDDYSDFGSTTNPKLGFLWEFVPGLSLRSSYGKSFQAPLLSQLHGIVGSGASPSVDPSSPGGSTDTLTIAGGNPNLGPQTSTAFSIGFDLQPSWIPDLSISSTYFHISFKDRILEPPVVGTNIFSDPVLIPFIQRNPPLAEVESYFNSPGFGGDSTGGGPSAVGAIFDDRYANIASTVESGVDIRLSYLIRTDFGQWSPSLFVSRLIRNTLQTTVVSPSYELSNTFGEPTKWKMRGNIAWNYGAWLAVIAANYLNSYQNTAITPPQTIDSWATGDLNVSYRTGDHSPSPWLNHFTVALSVLNFTDKKPPYVQLPSFGNPPPPYDSANASPIGRLIALQITKGW